MAHDLQNFRYTRKGKSNAANAASNAEGITSWLSKNDGQDKVRKTHVEQSSKLMELSRLRKRKATDAIKEVNGNASGEEHGATSTCSVEQHTKSNHVEKELCTTGANVFDTVAKVVEKRADEAKDSSNQNGMIKLHNVSKPDSKEVTSPTKSLPGDDEDSLMSVDLVTGRRGVKRNRIIESDDDEVSEQFPAPNTNHAGTTSDIAIDAEASTSKANVEEKEAPKTDYKSALIEETIQEVVHEQPPTRKQAKQLTLNFFNEATTAALTKLSFVTPARASTIVAARPFLSYKLLKERLDTVIGESMRYTLLERQEEFFTNQMSLEALLKKCSRVSNKLDKAAEEIKTGEAESFIVEQPKGLPKKLQLKPYQMIGLNWLVMMFKHKLNAVLADEMGLGKTIQIIAYLAYLKETKQNDHGTHLIVVPSSCINNWLEEFKRWCPKMVVLSYYGSAEDREFFRQQAMEGEYDDVEAIVTTYNIVLSNRDDRHFFRKCFDVDHAIFDEAHMLKNCTTQRYIGLTKIDAHFRILMTGTPLQNNLTELISLLHFVMPDFFAETGFSDIKGILQCFSSNHKSESARDYTVEKIEQAKKILHPFMLRRLKADVLKDLPKKQETIYKCKMTPDQATVYEEIKARNRRKYLEKGGNNAGQSLSYIMDLRKTVCHPLLIRHRYTDEKLREMIPDIKKIPQHSQGEFHLILEDLQFMSDFELHRFCLESDHIKRFALDKECMMTGGKFQALDKLLPPLKEANSKVLIFSQFTMMLDVLEAYCKLRGYSYLRMDGQTQVLIRQDMIDQFNSSPDLFIFLLSTKAGGLGINLASANNIIIHDIDYNPYNDKQAEDRCHRLGQTKQVQVTKLICEDSVEETMLKYAESKLHLEERITAEGKTRVTHQLLNEIFGTA